MPPSESESDENEDKEIDKENEKLTKNFENKLSI